MDNFALYSECKDRFSTLVSQAAQHATKRVPATPDWTVTDVAAHVTGIVTDILEGNLQGIGTDQWTDAQVTRRKGIPLDEILREWEIATSSLEEIFPLMGDDNSAALVQDLYIHECDVRGALGIPGGRDSASAEASFAFNIGRLSKRFDEAGIGSLRMTDGSAEWQAGSGQVNATCHAEKFELFRAISGRRTVDQIKAFEWTGNVDTFAPLIPYYPAAQQPIVE